MKTPKVKGQVGCHHATAGRHSMVYIVRYVSRLYDSAFIVSRERKVIRYKGKITGLLCKKGKTDERNVKNEGCRL